MERPLRSIRRVARHKDAFLVNLWFESHGEDGPESIEWRGSVEHLMTQQRRYFTDIVDLVTFLTAYTPKSRPENSDPG
jgi:hypothetical protein